MHTLTPEECASMIKQGGVCAFSGAGISTAAGIPDFRGVGGLYTTGKYDPDTVFDIGCFHHDPLPFFNFSRDFLSVVDTLKPTATHSFLAEIEEAGLLSAVVTQNIDPLHQLAGSKKVIALHGNYASAHCLNCSHSFNYAEFRQQLENNAIPRCESCNGIIKPDVVFFGEMVYGMEEAMAAVTGSQLLLILGSSLVVNPAASLPNYANRIVVVNKGKVSLSEGRDRYFVDSDIDTFFTQVREYM